MSNSILVVVNAIQAVLVIFVMIALGYILRKINWFTDSSSQLLTQICTGLLIPCMLFNNVITKITPELLNQAGVSLLVPLLSIASMYVLASLIAKLTNIPKERTGVFKTMFATTNSVLIGFPITLTLFGADGLIPAMYFYICNTTFFWTICIFSIRKDSGCGSSFFSKETLKKLITPQLAAMLLGVLFIVIGLKVPKFLESSTGYLGAPATPISLFLCGLILYRIGFKSIRYEKGMAWLLVGKFIIGPIIILLLSRAFGLSKFTQQVFVIQMSMPVMVQTYVMAEKYRADSEYATLGFTLTTLASLLFTPLYMYLFTFM